MDRREYSIVHDFVPTDCTFTSSDPSAQLRIQRDPDPTTEESGTPAGELEMNANGYINLSSPAAANRGGGRTRRPLQLTNTKETNAWEGLAIGVVTLARTVSTGSHRLCRSGERSRRDTRRHAAAPGKGDGYYWRIHDMDGDNACDEKPEEEAAGKKINEEQKVKGRMDKKIKMRRGNNILQACKKLFRV